MMHKTEILQNLNAQIHINGHIIGAVAGSGMTAKFVTMGGIDFLLALSAGRFRVTGRSSLASFLCYDNSNELVMSFGTRELLPIIKEIPILFGLAASDPTISLYEYLKRIKDAGFAGITNFPTIAMIDPHFTQQDVVDYCKENDIIIQTWSPLGRGAYVADPTLTEIGKNYGKTAAQVVLKWNMQRGCCVLPKASSKERLYENADLFDFTLSEEDMNRINAMNNGIRTESDPENFDF